MTTGLSFLTLLASTVVVTVMVNASVHEHEHDVDDELLSLSWGIFGTDELKGQQIVMRNEQIVFHPAQDKNDDPTQICRLSADAKTCTGANGPNTACKFLENRHAKMCTTLEYAADLKKVDVIHRILKYYYHQSHYSLCFEYDFPAAGSTDGSKPKHYNGICERHFGGICRDPDDPNSDSPNIKRRYCDLPELDFKYPDQNNPMRPMLFSIDGTGSEECDSKQKKHECRTTTNQWMSHVQNFVEDYDGVKMTWPGPDSNWLGTAEDECNDRINNIHHGVCEMIKRYSYSMIDQNSVRFGAGEAQVTEFAFASDIAIDIIGYSRGGWSAIAVARKLDAEGCHGVELLNANDEKQVFHLQSIPVRFLGLYDPVRMTWSGVWDAITSWLTTWYTGKGSATALVSKNVKLAAKAFANPEKCSRRVFRRLNFGKDDDATETEEVVEFFDCTHGGMGGGPWSGDHPTVGACYTFLTSMAFSMLPKGYNFEKVLPIMITHEEDNENSVKVDQFMRREAKRVGVPVKAKGVDEYGFTLDWD